MRTFEIYWDDLSEEAQTRLIAEGYEWGEIDTIPIAIIDQEEM